MSNETSSRDASVSADELADVVSTLRLPLEALRARFGGQLLRPGDADYGPARRVWNGAVDRRPAVIARCAHMDDVRTAVMFAREHDLLVAVRGGGHNVAGTAVCDRGLVIDLSAMRRISVDAAGRTALAEAGVLWGELDQHTQAFGLATTGGIVTHTGIAGLTLGGGIGWLMRKHGLSVDNLLAADVVTADGAVLRVSDEEHQDLFWGLRGGGGNFGIVTRFQYRLHSVGPRVLAGPVFYALEQAPEVLRFYRAYVAEAPDELTTIVTLRRAPALSELPEAMRGAPVLVVNACFAGPIEQGEKVLRPLRTFGPPLIDLIAPKTYTAHQAMLDATVPHGWHYYWKSWDLRELTDPIIDVLVEHAWALTSPLSYCIVFHLGGAVARIGEDETAYSHRFMAFNVNINAVWTADDPDAEKHIRWTRDFWTALQPHAPGGVYVNFLGDEGVDRVRAAYGDAKYARLRLLKDRYDPTNVLRLNQNIPPTAASEEVAARQEVVGSRCQKQVR
jgi:FAD/FMN-containing dehydrogenase